MAAGVYLHIPFCKSRCSYCDFATDVYRDSGAVERYVDALTFEIRSFQFDDSPSADTVYFGGGTPSLLSAEQVEQILHEVRKKFVISIDAEITMEMNPATVTPESLAAYRSLGVDRASFGVQTFNDRALKLLARGHDATDARQTFRMLCDAGFDNLSFDLIAGLPGQTMEDWRANLDEAIKLSPDHISLYLLEIHQGTPLAEQVRSGRQPVPNDELGAEMYELMLGLLAAVGYEQYEISNFARPGRESRHNIKYWKLDPVYGFGVSAHSFDGRERYSNERDTAKYVEMITSSGSAEVTREPVDIDSEAAFLGLRLEEGIVVDDALREKYGREIDEAVENGLLETDDGRLKLTLRGKLFSNDVFAIFV
jgi:oxygen-independent coproporphyrinogen-3 oxidase